MALVAPTAFQQSPAIQTRSFVALAALAISQVDDDFLYQILVAFECARQSERIQHGTNNQYTPLYVQDYSSYCWHISLYLRPFGSPLLSFKEAMLRTMPKPRHSYKLP